ncbi:pyridoxamine 5'-phosphate oxidase family protein [Tsukamurella pseudospumae]|uniref:Pyridoxamine 5-phosphate oxidase n=1 Tax=Tsukamurella pseudospumae TaxID=239498 RepID=A0A138AW50_9ACTN|nr:pyridoxamine 5'-phosphate oxidase family protein [Tsukamurella pseudospumae]KXP14678.1 pyridoxamine 5-phosphate oxidase [Tsukamurella pseudospumae]
MALSTSEKQQFLAQPHVAAFSVAEPGLGPLTVPVWYAYEPGGRPWITIGPTSRKARALEASGRFSLMVDTVEPRTMYVSVEGPVAESRTSTEEEIRAMAARYLSGPALDGYLDFAFGQLGEHLTVVLEPEHWLGADLTM